MATVSVSLRSVTDTGAAMGWAGGHTVVIDRNSGKAGGTGLGFNGAQMLGLAIGGCFCNDLRYKAEEMGITIVSIAVDVALELGGQPSRVLGCDLAVTVMSDDANADIAGLVAQSEQASTIGQSVITGFPVRVRAS
ncbi:Organic hydroperoxide reductase OsmC/OhrA [Devosia enhydra]|uniref:Organic hydroperoxide reductase OsmC/OhrA n=1 Tax=Devosia enhydra TaxID=665118 RepID=A0A1K2HUC4_9HYPH|nr:OsmC family protein [Devosia enhydra]SFZ81992.1 Organic hydroperoxide reductase OsmC/OhrA [Devosia enhydra]